MLITLLLTLLPIAPLRHADYYMKRQLITARCFRHADMAIASR